MEYYLCLALIVIGYVLALIEGFIRRGKLGWIGLFLFGIASLIMGDDYRGCYGKPSAMDVYQGKTILEITYKDGTPVDSVVVFKEKRK